MAYNWDWKRKSGVFRFDGYDYSFYKGNGFMIVIDEFKQGNNDLYHVAWFFVDKAHAKRCLGLEKGSYDMFEGTVEKITIYKENCSNWKDIVELFSKSQKDCVIEIHNKAPEVKENAEGEPCAG